MRDCSWILIDAPPPRRVKVHDIVTVIIDEKSEVTQNSRFDRQRNIVFRAQLREFLRIGTSGNLRPAALDQPSIDTQLRSQMNSYGTAKTNEGLKYRIGATVVDVLPNGTLVLEARKTIRTDAEVWEYSLTGRCRTEDINANNTLVSENVADLNISKILHGKVRDSAERGWLTALYDLLLPF
jgi:flagellar L-ring protein precursor FlgH